MGKKENIVTFKYPEHLLDKNGYPTSEALAYIDNWSMVFDVELNIGIYFSEKRYDELINYVKELWWGDSLIYEGGLLELHTYGWSGNESIIEKLKRTNLWLLKFRAKQVGGHYYFKVDDTTNNWKIIKTKEKKINDVKLDLRMEFSNNFEEVSSASYADWLEKKLAELLTY